MRTLGEAHVLLRAQARPRLRPNLDVIAHRPRLRVSPGRSDGRVFRRYINGQLDFSGAVQAILGALNKLREGADLTPIERAIASVVLPVEEAPRDPALAALTTGQLSDQEQRTLTGLVLAHLTQVSRAEGERLLTRSAVEWSLHDVRNHLSFLLARRALVQVKATHGPRHG